MVRDKSNFVTEVNNKRGTQNVAAWRAANRKVKPGEVEQCDAASLHVASW